MRNVFDSWPALVDPASMGASAIDAFKQGRADAAERETQSALSALALNPGDAAAFAHLARYAPAKAMAARDYQRKEDDAARTGQFRSALSDYLRGQHSAGPKPNLIGDPRAQASAFAGDNSTNAPGPREPDEIVVTGSRQPAQPHPLGVPQSDADAAFLRMLEADPSKAFEIDSKLRDNAAKRLKAADDAYDFAVARLANTNDDASYQATIQEVDARLRPLGFDVRTIVPPSYPGPEGTRALLMKALDAKAQIAALVSRDRLNAYVENIDADNERADRNTDSIIATRQAGVVTARRGQDLRPPRSPGRKGAARPTATGPNGQKVEFDGKSWVPVNG